MASQELSALNDGVPGVDGLGVLLCVGAELGVGEAAGHHDPVLAVVLLAHAVHH